MPIRSLRMKNSPRNGERRAQRGAEPDAARNRRRGRGDERDSKITNSSMMTLMQTGFCLVVLGFGLMMKISDSQPYHQARQWYSQVSTAPAGDYDPVAWVMGGGLERLRGEILSVFANNPPQQQSESQTQPESGTTQPSSSEAAGEAQHVFAPGQSSSGQGSSSQPEGSSLPSSEGLQSGSGQLPANKAGGWWPFSKQKQEQETLSKVPAGIWAAPVILSAPAVHPAYGKLTSGFGYRVHPVTGKSDFHRGIDIAAPAGAGVYAAWPGTVGEVGFSNVYGNYIRLDHTESLSTIYSHCSEILAKPGANLRAGDRIALVGATGLVTGPHLHFELVIGGLFANPLYAFDMVPFATVE